MPRRGMGCSVCSGLRGEYIYIAILNNEPYYFKSEWGKRHFQIPSFSVKIPSFSVNLSLANALRRIILNDINTVVFRTESYADNKCTIRTSLLLNFRRIRAVYYFNDNRNRIHRGCYQILSIYIEEYNSILWDSSTELDVGRTRIRSSKFQRYQVSVKIFSFYLCFYEEF